MNPIIRPHKALSFEDALRNLASRLTGTPVAELPRTQEAIVQYMAENIKLPEAPVQELPDVDIDKLCEAVTQEVMARIDMDALGEAVTKEVMARTAETVGAHDAYSAGAKVSHKNKHWTSDLDGNVWEPGVSGWTEVAAEGGSRGV